MKSFASLMAISATHTQENQLAVKHALQERQRKEALQRKQQQEKEAKERELEKKLRIQRFEEEKRQKEKMERMEAELRAKEVSREKKEEEQRNTLLYGRKKAAKIAASGGSSPRYPQSAAARDAAVSKRLGDDLDDEDSIGLALTREEIRQKKRGAELRRQLARGSTKRSTTGGYRKGGQSLPGGAVNIVVNANGESVTPVSAVSSDPSGVKSLKERLTQGPNTLVLLQTKVRDRRTVDEAQQDIRIKLGKAPNKVLSGEEARTFDDWFGNSKEKEKEKNPAKGSPAPRSASSTPAPSTSSIRPTSTASLPPSQKKAAATISRPSSTKPTVYATSKPSDPLRTMSTERVPYSSQTTLKISKASSKTTMFTSSGLQSSSSAKAAPQKLKRRRSLSRSESPPPPKRQRESGRFDIWEHITGKPKHDYIMRDIDSDESDMEADAFAVENEERVSSRMALKEDQLALEEERRHEEEKRRRKEKQRAMSRGY